MKNYQLRITEAAQDDLERLFDFLAQNDFAAALRAREAMGKAYEYVQTMPFACRKADPSNPFLRELLISFGNAGYVALFEIENDELVSILAVRHQREEDFH